jgi:uncharacterized membrane-anchored protein YjiN (DUF445 family)
MIDPHPDLKFARLRYMQRLATALLCAMVVLLVVSASLKTAYPWLQWVQAFAAAATVGAIADWFAVVALFYHPLGLPFPHTAIIPANKDRIGSSLGHFVENNFLTTGNIIRKLQQRNLALAGSEWLADDVNARKAAEHLCSLIPAALNTLGDQNFRRFLDRAITPQLRKLNLAGMAGDVLTILTADGRHQALLNKALQTTEEWLVANQTIIKTKFSEASKYTPGILDNYIVNRFVAGIIALLHDIAVNSDHQVRRQFDQFTNNLIHKLKTSDAYRAQGEALARELLEHLAREDYYAIVWKDLKLRILADLADSVSLLRTHVAEAIAKLGSVLRDDQFMQNKLHAWLLQIIEGLLVRHRRQVSALITEVVMGWDAREVGKKLELEIGKDLQYIRISGTLVGGTVGLFLHAIIGLL